MISKTSTDLTNLKIFTNFFNLYYLYRLKTEYIHIVSFTENYIFTTQI